MCSSFFFLGTLCLLQRNCLRLAKYVLIANRPKTPCGLAFTVVVVVVVVNNLSCEQALHLGASREVLRERHAKGDESAKAGKERSRVLS